MDIKSPEERSKNMAAIHSKNTKPEIYLRKLLFARGYRYGVNSKEIQKLFVFKEVNENRRLMYTIEYNLPSSLNFESDVNLFRKMSDNYMTDFKEKIDDLVDDLEAVKSETDEVEQCKMLSKIFGDDFPIPEKKNAAKKQMNFIPSTSASGVD